jgi:hypothetical protein
VHFALLHLLGRGGCNRRGHVFHVRLALRQDLLPSAQFGDELLALLVCSNEFLVSLSLLCVTAGHPLTLRTPRLLLLFQGRLEIRDTLKQFVLLDFVCALQSDEGVLVLAGLECQGAGVLLLRLTMNQLQLGHALLQRRVVDTRHRMLRVRLNLRLGNEDLSQGGHWSTVGTGCAEGFCGGR